MTDSPPGRASAPLALRMAPMTSPAEHEKRALRAELRERRELMTSSEKERASIGLTDNLRALVERTGAASVACYLSSPSEPDTRPFLRWAQERGMRILFPVTRADGLLDWTVGEAGIETEGFAGTPEIEGERLGPIAINDVDLILVPAAAVDCTGLRMGWGRGYFDKTLGSMEQCPPVYAILYDGEILDQVPREVHDEPVGGAVTPTRILDFTPARPRR